MRHSAPRQHGRQMRPVLCRGMDIAQRDIRLQFAFLQNLGRHLRSQGPLGIGPAVNATAQTGQRHTHLLTLLGHGHTGQGKTRSRLLKLEVMRLLRARKLHPQHDLVRRQGGAEQAGEKFVRGQLSAVGKDSAVQRHQTGRPAGRRVSVGD